jgi:hypothetical protein
MRVPRVERHRFGGSTRSRVICSPVLSKFRARLSVPKLLPVYAGEAKKSFANHERILRRRLEGV